MPIKNRGRRQPWQRTPSGRRVWLARVHRWLSADLESAWVRRRLGLPAGAEYVPLDLPAGPWLGWD